MISKRSRYRTGRLDVVGQTVEVTRPDIPKASGSNKGFYVWREGMRLDLLAERYYGNADEWWKILDLNPLIMSENDLRPGMLLRVPGA